MRALLLSALATLGGLALLLTPGRAETAPDAATDGGAVGYTEAPVTDGGTLRGVVSFTGQPPQPRVYRVDQDVNLCGSTKEIQPVRAEEGKLADVVVALKEVHRGKAINGNPRLDLQQCELVPRVQAMVAGQRLVLYNHDPVASLLSGIDARERPVFRFLQPIQGSKHKKRITEVGLIHVKGDEDRPWVQAWIYVSEHPYVAVTGPRGTFTLTDVPAGSWELIAWHPTLGTRSQTVEVRADEATEANFDFQSGHTP